MAISASAVWRAWINGADINGGGFDPNIVSAGTDYSNQAAAQLAITDLTTSGASATVGSVSGGFTSAMIGNTIRIASGTNFTAGTYFITAVGSTNAATLDRVCSTASGASGVAKVGGAKATPAGGAAVAVAGNVILVKGQGSFDPIDIDYAITNFSLPAGVAMVGYNGRPKIGHNCYGINMGIRSRVENLMFTATSVAFNNYGGIYGGAYSVAQNCVFDSSGQDATQVSSVTLLRCSFINTGNQAVGTRPIYASYGSNYGVMLIDCLFKDQRFNACDFGMLSLVEGCIFQNNNGDGLVLAGTTGSNNASWIVRNNTFYNNAGHGINLAVGNATIVDNLIVGHTGAGKYGINIADGVANATYTYSAGALSGNNFYGNTTNSNIALGSGNTTLDPQFVNAPTDLTPTNTALRYLSGVGSA
jgi:hypothetical protein